MSAYRSLCTEFYDLDKPSAPADALAFYVNRARKAGSRILEPMCGSGRFLLPIAQAGVTIDGVDSSAEMLAACRARARSLGLEVTVFMQELASLQLEGRYTMAFIPSGSIGLVTKDEVLREALSRLHAHLQPNGALLLEVECDAGPSVTPTELEAREVLCQDGTSITYTCTATRSQTRDTICYSGTYSKRQGARTIETESEELVLRVYAPQQIASELEACGFKTTTVTTAADLPFLAASGCVLVEARADAS
jgi:SAM-dependent methyltransferase